MQRMTPDDDKLFEYYTTAVQYGFESDVMTDLIYTNMGKFMSTHMSELMEHDRGRDKILEIVGMLSRAIDRSVGLDWAIKHGALMSKSRG